MSGLEPLAAFGLACNVMQVIGFGRDVVTTCRAIYQTGSLDTSLTADADHLASALGELEMSLKLPCGPLNADEQALVDIAVEGQAAAKELKTEVHKISGNASKGKAVQAISGGFKTAFRKRRIEKLEKALMASQRALESRVLVRIWYGHPRFPSFAMCRHN
jgi:hypothetical protein